MPLHKDVESGQGKGQPRLEVRPAPMQDLFQMTNAGQHRQHGLNQHSGIPVPSLTELEIGRIPFLGMESGITQNNHLALEGFDEGMKGGVWRISPCTVPRHNQAQVVEEQTELTAHNPAM